MEREKREERSCGENNARISGRILEREGVGGVEGSWEESLAKTGRNREDL